MDFILVVGRGWTGILVDYYREGLVECEGKFEKFGTDSENGVLGQCASVTRLW